MASSTVAAAVPAKSQSLTLSYCKPCIKLGYVHQAIGFCQLCLEFYCQSCLHTHGKVSVTQHHTLLTGKDMPSAEEVKQLFCYKHGEKLKEMYCFNHCLLVCVSCCSSDHKKCNVQSLAEACATIDLESEKEKFKEHLAELQTYSENVKQAMEENKTDLEKQKQTLIAEAETFRDKIVQNANKCCEDFKVKIDSIVSERTTTLTKHNKTVVDISSNIKCILQDLQQQNADDSEEGRYFLHFHSHVETTRNYLQTMEKVQQELVRTDLKTKFNPNIISLTERQMKFVDVAECVTKMRAPSKSFTEYKCRKRRGSNRKSRGSLKLDEKMDSLRIEGGKQTAPSRASVLDPFLVKTGDDLNDSDIRGLAVIKGNTLLLADNTNMALKLFTSDGCFISSLQMKTGPNDVAVLNDLEAVVSMNSKEIGIVDVTNNRQLSLTRQIDLENNVNSLTTYKDNIIAVVYGNPSLLKMINRKGEILWTVSHDSDNKRLFQRPGFLTTCSVSDQTKVIVTDIEKQTITLLDARAGTEARVCDVGEKEPIGITADDNGNVFVSYKSGGIYVWHTNMKEEKCILPAYLGVISPFAIAFSQKWNVIYVTSNSKEEKYCNYIHRYALL